MTVPPETPNERARRLYGIFASDMLARGSVFDRTAEQAAFIYLTGLFPSHLRRHSVHLLRLISTVAMTPDTIGTGPLRLRREAFQDLGIEEMPIVRKIQEYAARGYVIERSHQPGARRNYWRYHLYRPVPGSCMTDRITVFSDAAVVDGWDQTKIRIGH